MKFSVGSPGIRRNKKNVSVATAQRTKTKWPTRSRARRAIAYWNGAVVSFTPAG